MSLGIVLAIIASVCFGISVALQKYGLKSLKKFSFKGMATNKRWMLSIVIGIVGILLYLVALNLADLSVVQPLTSLTIIIPVIAGVTFFKEKIGGVKWALLALVIVGVILISMS